MASLTALTQDHHVVLLVMLLIPASTTTSEETRALPCAQNETRLV